MILSYDMSAEGQVGQWLNPALQRGVMRLLGFKIRQVSSPD